MIHITGNALCIAKRPEKIEPRPQATRTKIGEVRPCGFRDMWTDRHTDTQTDTLITIRRTSSGGGQRIIMW